MTFKEKIDKILSFNDLNINSVSGLEDFVKAGRGAINEFYNDNREPGRKTLKKIKSFPELNSEWYDTGEGPIFNKKPTPVDITPNLKENMSPKETFYSDLIEKNEDYSLIPRAVLTDYKIVPDKIIDVIIQSNENEKKALVRSKEIEIESLNKKYELMIEGFKNKITRLESEKEDLLRQIPAKK